MESFMHHLLVVGSLRVDQRQQIGMSSTKLAKEEKE
jgi:hypothetical protein